MRILLAVERFSRVTDGVFLQGQRTSAGGVTHIATARLHASLAGVGVACLVVFATISPVAAEEVPTIGSAHEKVDVDVPVPVVPEVAVPALPELDHVEAPEPLAAPAIADPTGGAALTATDTPQILPVSPVPGGNDPNASTDVLYVLEENNEDNARRARLGRRAHFFVGPSGRVATSLKLSPALSVEAFVTSGFAAFEKVDHGFGTRSSNVSGGLNANGDLKLFNLALAYQHGDSHTEFFGPRSAATDRVGITLNKTYPFFIQNLRFTPQVLAADEIVDPFHSSSANVEATGGFTYDWGPRLSFAASAGYQAVFLYGAPGYKHNSGLKLIVGATYRVTDRFTVVAGGTTARTILYGLPTYRADGSISPSLTARYQIMPGLTGSIVANYGRFISTATGQGNFKYNVNPSLALTVPL